MKWAHVSFIIDGVKVNVPFNFIENYDDGIVVGQVCHVFWSPNANDTPQGILEKEGRVIYIDKSVKRTKTKCPAAGWYRASVLLIGDSEEELEEVIRSKRVKSSQPLEIDSEKVDAVSTSGKKQLMKAANKNNLKNLSKGILPQSLESDDSDEDGSFVLKSEVDTLRKGLSDLQSLNSSLRKRNSHMEETITELKRINSSLREELSKEKSKNERLTDLNIAYQERELNGSVKRAPEKLFTKLPLDKENVFQDKDTVFQDKDTVFTEVSSPAEDDDQSDFHVEIEKYLTVETYKRIKKSAKPGIGGDSIFIKNLTSALWSVEELVERSSQGIACPTKKGEQARPECTPEKKDYMKLLLEKRIRSEIGVESRDIESRMKKLNSYISSKITTVRRDLKNKMKD